MQKEQFSFTAAFNATTKTCLVEKSDDSYDAFVTHLLLKLFICEYRFSFKHLLPLYLVFINSFILRLNSKGKQ